MTNGLRFTCCLIALAVAGCTLSPRYRLPEVKAGMSMEQVLDILGEPVRTSWKEPYDAWLYEFKYRNPSNPRRSPSRHAYSDDFRCLYAVVWFEYFEVTAVTGNISDRVEYCGLGAIPVNWDDMPEAGD